MSKKVAKVAKVTLTPEQIAANEKAAKLSAAAKAAWATRRAKATDSLNPSISAKVAWVTRRIIDPIRFPEPVDPWAPVAKGKGKAA